MAMATWLVEAVRTFEWFEGSGFVAATNRGLFGSTLGLLIGDYLLYTGFGCFLQ